MKNVMRNNDHRLRLDSFPNRLYQLTVELTQMILSGFQQQLRMRLHVCGLEVEVRQLERQTLQRGSHRSGRRQIANDLEFVVADDKCLKAVCNCVVLHDDFVWPEHSLYF